jgi:hypothetical protein
MLRNSLRQRTGAVHSGSLSSNASACSVRSLGKYRYAKCVFRKSVTGRFGIVTAEFGNVTEHFGDVTDGHLMAA